MKIHSVPLLPAYRAASASPWHQPAFSVSSLAPIVTVASCRAAFFFFGKTLCMHVTQFSSVEQFYIHGPLSDEICDFMITSPSSKVSCCIFDAYLLSIWPKPWKKSCVRHLSVLS